MFYVGQKVVCVDVSVGAAGLPVRTISLGDIYTVTGCRKFGSTEAIWVAEAKPEYEEWGFYAYRFRPVVERKTDISIFTDMLKPKSSEVAA